MKKIDQSQIIRFQKNLDLTCEMLRKYISNTKMWGLVINETSFEYSTLEQRKEFTCNFISVCESCGWKFENFFGDEVWEYDITRNDVDEKLELFRQKLIDLKDSPLRLLPVCQEDGSITTV